MEKILGNGLTWRESITDQENSGLSISDYCKKYNLNENYFYTNRCRLKLTSKHKNREINFVELNTPSIKNDYLTIGVGNIEIKVNESTDDKLLLKVLKVLSNV